MLLPMTTEPTELTTDLALEPWSRPARGLREYVRAVADRLGCTGDAFWVQTESPVSAYLPLEQELDGREAALLWDWRHGWAAEVADERIVARLGGDPLPPPVAVATFVAELVAGQRIDRQTELVEPALLAARLAEYAPALAC